MSVRFPAAFLRRAPRALALVLVVLVTGVGLGSAKPYATRGAHAGRFVPVVSISPSSGTVTDPNLQFVVEACDDAGIQSIDVYLNGGSVLFNDGLAPDCGTGTAGTVDATLVEGTNTLEVTACNTWSDCTTGFASVTYSPITYGIGVSADQGSVSFQSGLSAPASFTISNTGSASGTVSWSASCGAPASCSGSGSFALASGASQGVSVTVGGSSAGTGSVSVSAWYQESTGTTGSASSSVSITSPPPGDPDVAVGGAASAIEGGDRTVDVEVSNPSTFSRTFSLSTSCTVVSCSTPASVTIGSQGSQFITLTTSAPCGTANQAATASVTASDGYGTGTGSAGFSVQTNNTPASITVQAGSTTILAGETTTATATVRNSCNTAVVASVLWSSSNTAVATIDASGTITGVAQGTTNIIGTVQGTSISATLALTVSPPVASASVTATDATKTVGTGMPVTLTFTITNTSTTASTFNVTATCPSSVVASGCPAAFTTPSLNANATYTVTLSLTSASVSQSTTANVTVTASATGGTPASAATALTVSATSVQVTPTAGSASGTINSAISVTYTVTNNGLGQTTYTLTLACPAVVVSGCTAPAPVTVAGGASTNVTLNLGTGSQTGTGDVTLTATAGTVSSTGKYTLTVGNPPPPPTPTISVSARPLNPLGSDARDQCLTIAAGDAAAYECGDLRIVHAVPGVRTMNKDRAPTLIYNSGQQTPIAHLAANVTVTSAAPDSVTATLILNPGTGDLAPITRKYGWNSACASVACRIVVPIDAVSNTLATGWYHYSLQTSMVVGGQTYPSNTDTGSVVIVNRRTSPFGAGWWLDGFEQLITFPAMADSTKKLWVGGDGSTRLFVKTIADTFVVQDVVDRPDTLVRVTGGLWRRHLPNGAYVEFNNTGQHMRTVNSEGQVTTFAWTSALLDSIMAPVPSGSGTSRAWKFSYADSGSAHVVSSVTSPGVSGVRTTTIGHGTFWQVTSITDPDTKVVHFLYDGSGNRITSRKNRLGDSTVYAYDAYGALTSATRSMAGAAGLVTSFCAAETRSLAVCSGDGVSARMQPMDSVYTRLDGARTDATDVTKFFINRFGAPDKIVNAVNRTTTITRSATFPALASVAVDPAGFEQRAYFNGRGLTDSTVAVDPYDQGCGTQSCNAVTKFTWDTKWAAVKTVRGPTGDTTTTWYSTSHAHPDSMQVGSVAVQRVKYAYNPDGQVARVTDPAAQSDSVMYDATLGNVSATRTPMGFIAYTYRDALGRDTLATVPTDSAQTSSLRKQIRTTYDVMDRVDSVLTMGAAVSYTLTSGFLAADTATIMPDTVYSKHSYDGEGRPTSVTAKSSSPYGNIPANVSETWTYDPAGRAMLHHRNTAVDTTVYDAAGNVTRTATSGGRGTSQSYDALNRLVRRIADSVSTARETCGALMAGPITGTGSGCFVVFPAFPNATSGRWTVAADTAVFAYDSAGNMTVADNHDATVHRAYYRSGAIKRDSTSFRAVSSSLYDHATVLVPHYTLAGRRDTLTLTNAQKLAYAYRAGDGLLSTVYDPIGTPYRYVYDVVGRIDSLVVGDSIIREKRAYDPDGRRIMRERRAKGFTSGLNGDTLRYDAQGRVIYAGYGTLANSSAHSATYVTYSGLGAVLARERVEPFNWEVEEFRVDALGNVLRSRASNSSTSIPMPQISTYALRGPLTSRAALPNPSFNQERDTLTQTFDVDGQLTRSQHQGRDRSNAVTVETILRNYYGRDGTLRVAQRYSDTPTGAAGAWEEYRYDALGRRVMVIGRISTPSAACTDAGLTFCAGICVAAGCVNHVTRTQWDGDQILGEVRTDLTDGVPNDNYGAVTYVHGLALDQPLAALGGGGAPANGVRVLNPDWRGLFESSVATTGASADCSMPYAGCTSIAWPSGRGVYTRPGPSESASSTSFVWAGTLLTDQQDGTGQLFRRNRYYDPDAGRFTQEDPIGLGGGNNLYGFASGDPLNFSDPFGLCPWCNTVGGLWNGDYTDAADERKISTLREEVQRPARQLVNRSALMGSPIGVAEGFRDNATQDRYYAQGRTAPGDIITNARGGESYHNYGLALDVYPLKRGAMNFKATLSDYSTIANVGAEIGFEWGGAWKRKDMPHFQMTGGRSILDLEKHRP